MRYQGKCQRCGDHGELKESEGGDEEFCAFCSIDIAFNDLHATLLKDIYEWRDDRNQSDKLINEAFIEIQNQIKGLKTMIFETRAEVMVLKHHIAEVKRDLKTANNNLGGFTDLRGKEL